MKAIQVYVTSTMTNKTTYINKNTSLMSILAAATKIENTFLNEIHRQCLLSLSSTNCSKKTIKNKNKKIKRWEINTEVNAFVTTKPWYHKFKQFFKGLSVVH